MKSNTREGNLWVLGKLRRVSIGVKPEVGE